MKNIFVIGGLEWTATVSKLETVQKEGSRTVTFADGMGQKFSGAVAVWQGVEPVSLCLVGRSLFRRWNSENIILNFSWRSVLCHNHDFLFLCGAVFLLTWKFRWC